MAHNVVVLSAGKEGAPGLVQLGAFDAPVYLTLCAFLEFHFMNLWHTKKRAKRTRLYSLLPLSTHVMD